MKCVIFVLAAVVLSLSATAQSDRKYKSKELTKYFEQRRELFATGSGLPTLEDVLAFRSPYCKIEELEDYSDYSVSKAHRPPYRDSIDRICEEQYALGNKLSYLTRPRNTIGGIDKYDIIKYGQRDSLAAFIYTSYEYTDFFFAGPTLWIARSKDNAKTWEHYFTGLHQQQPIDLKWYSELPLFRDWNTLQIEGALMQQTELAGHPGPGAKFGLAKDGIAIVFDLDTITRDSDGDGLTDIVEAKFRTNPTNRDTNGNGIPDNLDLNPCNNTPRTELTAVFETLIDRQFEPIDWAEIERVNTLPDSLRHIEAQKQWGWKNIEQPGEQTAALASDSTKTVLIVTDDDNIKAIRPKYVRTIIISSEEYKKSSDPIFKTELEGLSITPACRVNGKKTMYLINTSYLTSGATYLVQKTKNGWRIKMVSMWIS